MNVIYVARDLDNRLFMYSVAPNRNDEEGIFVMNSGTCLELPGTLFPEITYENSPRQFISQ